MARVVAVHGIGNEYSGPERMAAAWVPALLSGVTLAGGKGRVAGDDIACAFFGDVYRGLERTLGDDVPFYGPGDVEDGFERELLLAWWARAATVDPAVVPPPDERTLGVATSVQAALAALSCSRLVAGVSERMLIFFIKQVRRYFTDSAIRARIRDRVTAVIGPDTRVVVAHSLGSVVAYEALCAPRPDWNVIALVTVGSPLGIRNLIFDRLEPPPVSGGGAAIPRGAWPGTVTQWTNIADRVDFVALVKKLGPLFGDAATIVDVQIDNGWRVHGVERYLTAHATGAAVLNALTDAGIGADG